ncbi:MAG: M42 family peptidase [Metamycoplasmataceae bacterium]
MKKEIYNKLVEYVNLEAMSRFEEPVVKKLKENAGESFEYKRDGLGSIIFSQKNKPKDAVKIAVVAHMDEVGFIVQDILDNGQVILSMIGGIWPLTVIGTKAILINSKNERLSGVFGHTSIHILEAEKRNKVPELKDLYVDLGFKDKKEAIKNNVEIGNCVYLTGSPFLMNENVAVGKAIDNRAGVVVIDQLLKRIGGRKLDSQLFIVGSTQEEVGTRGAKTSVKAINPNIAIAIDTCAAHDTFGAIKGIQALGEGVALRIKDGSTLMDPKLIDWIMEVANKNNIKAYKYVAQGGGTDAAELQYGATGVATITFSIPQRYLHSPLGACDLRDIIATIDLIEQVILELNNSVFLEKIAYK